jgi:hypothetical protein
MFHARFVPNGDPSKASTILWGSPDLEMRSSQSAAVHNGRRADEDRFQNKVWPPSVAIEQIAPASQSAAAHACIVVLIHGVT